jgi:hypothetical protein
MSNSVLSIPDVQKSLSLNNVTNYCSSNAVYPASTVIQANTGETILTQTIKANFPAPSFALVFSTLNIDYKTDSTLTVGDTLELTIEYDTPNGGGSNILWNITKNIPISSTFQGFVQNNFNVDVQNGLFTQGTFTFRFNIFYRTTGTTPITLVLGNNGQNNAVAIVPLSYVP